jgi:hypothetical protein
MSDIDDDTVTMLDSTDDDAFAEGDPTIDDIDPSELMRLADRIAAVEETPEGDERNFAALGLLVDLYGDDLEIV